MQTNVNRVRTLAHFKRHAKMYPVLSCANVTLVTPATGSTVLELQVRIKYHFRNNSKTEVLALGSCLDRFDRNYRELCAGSDWVERFYFDHIEGECKLFWYNGCRGTSRNVFSDVDTCQGMCERQKVLNRKGMYMNVYGVFKLISPLYLQIFVGMTLITCIKSNAQEANGTGAIILTTLH